MSDALYHIYFCQDCGGWSHHMDKLIGYVAHMDCKHPMKYLGLQPLPKTKPVNDQWRCPICNTAEESEVFLAGIAGTEDYASGVMAAEKFHVRCLELIWDKERNILVQVLPERTP